MIGKEPARGRARARRAGVTEGEGEGEQEGRREATVESTYLPVLLHFIPLLLARVRLRLDEIRVGEERAARAGRGARIRWRAWAGLWLVRWL